ncbi:enhancer of rudimentary [Obelidium mucronatum]|nr:enhancer of rudimentary [Obelidium mucronatum]
MDQLREKTHTILFLQTSSSTSSRVWSDFDTPLETLEALIRTFETKLKEQNGTRDVAYTIAELHAFIDSIDDLGVLVFSPQLAAYRPFEREWVKRSLSMMFS